MTFNSRLRAFIGILAALLMLMVLATALARRPSAPRAAAVVDQTVVLNVKTKRYHCPACELVRNCGTDCVSMDIAEALRRGARPCVTCGGSCLARR